MAAPVPAVLVEGGSSVDSTKFVTSTHTPTANRTLFFGIGHRVGSSNLNSLPSVEGNGCTWVLHSTISRQTGAAEAIHLTVYRAQPSAPVTGNTTIFFTESSVKVATLLYSLIEVTGAGTSSTDGAGAVVQATANSTQSTRITVSLAPFAATSNVALGFTLGKDATPYSTGAGYTVLSSRGLAGGENLGLLVEHTTNSTAVVSSHAGSNNVVAVALEIREQGAISSSANFTLNVDMAGSATFAGLHALFEMVLGMEYQVLRGLKTGEGITSGVLRLEAGDLFSIASKLYNSTSPNVAFYQTVDTVRTEIPLTRYRNTRYMVLVPASTNTVPLRLAGNVSGTPGFALSSRGFSVFTLPENSTGNPAIYTTSSGSTAQVRVLAL